MWWPKLLIYGNYGGPGWSGGEFVYDPKLVDWSVPPIDDMDALFKQHDFEVQNHIPKPHSRLSRDLCETVIPKKLWPKLYRYAAIGIFWAIGKVFNC